MEDAHPEAWVGLHQLIINTSKFEVSPKFLVTTIESQISDLLNQVAALKLKKRLS